MKRELASRLVVGLEGTWPTDFEVSWLTQWQPYGVILFSRNAINYSTLRDLCRELHQLVPGLEIMADHEGGPVSQLARALGRPPSAWSLGVLDDVSLTARVFEQTGQRLREAGIDRVLAPVADVLTEIRNPVIGTRSFGSDPSLVSRHTVAAVTGLLEADMKVCLKHWPGHGGSSTDSHLQEAIVRQGAVPAPFESGLTAGAGAVMIGHLLQDHPGDERDFLPATLDREFLSASRKSLGPGHVENLVFIADDVTMGALGPAMQRLGVSAPEPEETGLFDPGSLPVTWFERFVDAGCDRLLIRGIPWAAFPLSDTPASLDRRTESKSEGGGEFPAGPYEEARLRLWARVGPEFVDGKANLLWLDFSRADRWGAAAGQDVGSGSGGGLDDLQFGLSRMFHSVSTAPESFPVGQFWDRLVVSSHRPLPDMTCNDGSRASRGVCLVMGHPSLQTDLEGLLGMGWEVVALYDIAPEDLIFGPQKPEH